MYLFLKKRFLAMKYTATTSPPNKPSRLRTLRLSRGLSQSALAAAVGVSTRTVKYWEHGQRTPNAASLLALAHYFDVPPESLLP
mgnify:FL=1